MNATDVCASRRLEGVLLIISYVVRIDAHIHYADIVTAFLNGDID